MAFKLTICTEEVDKLPLAEFNGQIMIIDSFGSSYDAAVRYLSKQSIIGFDTETKPSFTANTKKNKVAILQLSGMDKACIFKLHNIGLPKEVASILSSGKIIKVGAAVLDDIRSLQHHTRFLPKGFVDLQKIVSNWGIGDKSVRKMAAIILGMRVSKSQQLSNWESPELTSAQINYAAIDAWICRKMYLALLSTPLKTE